MRGMASKERDLEPGKAALGERIKTLRAEKNLSKVKAAEIAGISDVYWGMFERGKRADGKPHSPEAITIINVAEAVGLDASEALRVYGHNPRYYANSIKQGRPTASKQEVAAKLDQLSADQLSAVSGVVDAILRAKGILPPESEPTSGETMLSQPRWSASEPTHRDET